MIRLVSSFGSQAILKHILTIGDKLIALATGLSNDSKGIYSLVSDLGSLVARIIFHPIEEMSRSLFSQNLKYSKSNIIATR